MQATSLLTLDDLDAMPDDGVKRELLHGELIEVTFARAGHSRLAKKIFQSVESHGSRNRLGEGFVEAGYRLFRDDTSGVKPDVSFQCADRPGVDDNDYFQGAPDIAFEVISPSERAVDVEAKLNAYLETDVKAVVHVYPAARKVRVFLASGEEFTLREEDNLRIPSVLPGWELRLSELFGS